METPGASDDLMAAVSWNSDGLVPVIAQDKVSGEVLMLAWMNRTALEETLACGQAVYWSRSRNRLWAKGESSGHTQQVHAVSLDCDGDTLLLSVEQHGGIACHTGRRSCFYRELRGDEWQTTADVIKDPREIYK